MSQRRRPHSGPSRLCGVQPKRLGAKEAEMKIVGCDLHARQQTIAMVDTATGEFTEKTLEHRGERVREFTRSCKVRWWWASKLPDRCSGSWSYWKSWVSSVRWDIRRRSERKKRGSRSTTGGTQACCWNCSARIAFRRYGCRRRNSETCELYCETVT